MVPIRQHDAWMGVSSQPICAEPNDPTYASPSVRHVVVSMNITLTAFSHYNYFRMPILLMSAVELSVNRRDFKPFTVTTLAGD